MQKKFTENFGRKNRVRRHLRYYHSLGAGEDGTVNIDDLSLADDLEVAELVILQQLSNVARQGGLHSQF